MAVTIKGRSGSKLTFDVRYWNPGKTALINTTGYTARLQLRSLQRPARVLLTTHEYTAGDPIPAGTVLWRIAPGHWRVLLDAAVTMSLPPNVRVEVELVKDSNANDVSPLFSGVINVDPQVVANV